jgi:hypothetical protein
MESKIVICTCEDDPDAFLVKNRVIANCDLCLNRILVAPSTHNIMKNDPGLYTMICIDCFPKLKIKNPEFMPFTDEQKQEVGDALEESSRK